MDKTVVEIHESEFAGDAEENAVRLHSLLSEGLGFPEYSGANLSALDDCLGDLCGDEIVIVELEGRDSYLRSLAIANGEAVDEPTWLERFVRVLARNAREGCIELVLTHR